MNLDEYVNFLLGHAVETEKELYWANPISNEHNSIDIYSGTSGIGLLFIELCTNIESDIYLKYLNKIYSWTKRNFITYPFKTNSFYTGKLGVAYFLIKCEKLLGYDDHDWVISELKKGNIKSSNKFELLNGKAGEIIGLLHLYNLYPQKYFTDRIQDLLFQFIDGVKIGYNGLFWDYAPYHYSPLTGFSHGLSGIAFVLHEVSKYFNEDIWRFLADQALLCENINYNSQIGNWIDRRKRGNMNMFVDDFLKKDAKRFKTVSDSATWCYGSPGIVLARLQSITTDSGDYFADDLKNGINKLRGTLKQPENLVNRFNLCHGLAGNALLLDIVNDDSQNNIRLIDKTEKDIRRYFDINGDFGFENDHSLFTGTAGSIYFIVKQQFKNRNANILYPVIGQYDKTVRLSNTKSFEQKLFRTLNSKIWALSMGDDDINRYSFVEDVKSFLLKKFHMDRSENQSKVKFYQFIYDQQKNCTNHFKSFVQDQFAISFAKKVNINNINKQNLAINPSFMLVNQGLNHLIVHLPTFPNSRLLTVSNAEFDLLRLIEEQKEWNEIESTLGFFPRKELMNCMMKGVLIPSNAIH